MVQITPPVGFNLFVIQGLTGHNILQVARATLPVFFLLLAAVIIISVFLEIVPTRTDVETLKLKSSRENIRAHFNSMNG
jgi:TRAP-type C4-dicarboxylate transport system permease large subunit